MKVLCFLKSNHKVDCGVYFCTPSKVCICKLCSKRKGLLYCTPRKVCKKARLKVCKKARLKVCKKARLKVCNMFARDSGQNTHLKVCKNTHLFEKHALIKVCEFGDK